MSQSGNISRKNETKSVTRPQIAMCSLRHTLGVDPRRWNPERSTLSWQTPVRIYRPSVVIRILPMTPLISHLSSWSIATKSRVESYSRKWHVESLSIGWSGVRGISGDRGAHVACEEARRMSWNGGEMSAGSRSGRMSARGGFGTVRIAKCRTIALGDNSIV